MKVDSAPRTGELSRAVTAVLGHVREIEEEILVTADPDWVARNGPRLRRIEDANILYYRDSDTVRTYNMMPKGDDYDYDRASRAYLQLAATCLKIAIDYEVRNTQEERRLMRMLRTPAEVLEDDDDEQ